MTRCVVDASVAVKWLVRKSHADEASRLSAGGISIMAPDLRFAEAANRVA